MLIILKKKNLSKSLPRGKNISNHFLKSKIKKFLQMGSSLEYGDTISPKRKCFIQNLN